MKNNKRFQAIVGGLVLVAVLCVVTPLNTMISQKSTAGRLRMQPSFPSGVYPELVEGKGKPERYKNKLIWVRTSDNVRMELPEWQIGQMKAVQHKGAGTQYHWVDASMVTSDELALVQKALNISDNLEEFRKFYATLTEDQKGTLINSASKLEMQGLTSLLMAYSFPENVQEQIGASVMQVASGATHASIIAPVVEYLKKKQKKIFERYSPDGNDIVSGTQFKNLLIDQKTIDYIATQLNIAQARFLHRLYIAQKNEEPVVLDTQDADYQIYLTLPDDVQHVIKLFLPFESPSDFVEKQIQEKMNEYRLKFKKTAATTADKIKTLTIIMKDFAKDSIDYKACERLLHEVELEAAFEV